MSLTTLRVEWQEDARTKQEPPPWALADIPAAARYLEWLMDRDRKSPSLKRLQGEIWAEGFRDGTLRGEVFADVPPALRRWRDAGLGVAIYSSGSVLAQKMLFRSTPHGDLTDSFVPSDGRAVSPNRAVGRRDGDSCSGRSAIMQSNSSIEPPDGAVPG